MKLDNRKFNCPECGSDNIKQIYHYKSKSGDCLYSSVLKEIQCGFCFMDIPSQLD